MITVKISKTAAKVFTKADKLQMTAAKQYRQAAKTKAKELLLPTYGLAKVGLEVSSINCRFVSS